MQYKKPSAIASIFRFLGQKVGKGKVISPEDNKALKSELTAIIEQCIILYQICSFKENISALNQHCHNLARNHIAAHLEENTVAKQFTEIASRLTAVAEVRFDYAKPHTLQKK